MSCEDCKWCDTKAVCLEEGEGLGMCRKGLPTVELYNNRHYAIWGLVDIEKDFCGEFQEKEE